MTQELRVTTDSRNLLPNGSFDLGDSGWSSLGNGVGWGNLSRLHGRIETTGGRMAARSCGFPSGTSKPRC